MKNRFGEDQAITPALIKTPSNRSMLITTGLKNELAPGDSVNVTYAIVAAKKLELICLRLILNFRKGLLY
ncbi:MAG: hypothetical protein H6613_17605 [Ignavibacteriales bacterium]|nr:hypothetical protein [Ignavibacteriales bacterium]